MSMRIITIVEELLGGENLRFDSGARNLTVSARKVDEIANQPDLSSATTNVIWDVTTSYLKTPSFVGIMVDPDGTYEDDAATPARVTFEFSTATDTAGTAEAVKLCLNARRELPILLAVDDIRNAITDAAANRFLSKIRARSNMVSGFGSIPIRVLIR